MPQLDFFNILSQIEYSIIVFFFFYIFNIFFVIPTILSIFQLRTIFFNFPFQIINFVSNFTNSYSVSTSEVVRLTVLPVNITFSDLILAQYFNTQLLQYLNEEEDLFV